MPTNIFYTPGSEIAHANGFQVCPYFIGHGIGSHFHCHPEIWHHGEFGSVVGWCFKLLVFSLTMSPNVFLIDRASSFSSLSSANDNDMTMDEGMAFTIGELPLTVFALTWWKDATVFECEADTVSFVEPILMEGSVEFRILKDKWTAVSADDKR